MAPLVLKLPPPGVLVPNNAVDPLPYYYRPLIGKVFAGGADASLVAELKRNFKTVKHAKPPASRKGSSEWYVVAQGFKGRSATPALE